MKTLKTLSALVLAAGLIFTSCKKKDSTPDPTTPVTPNDPSITFIPGTGYTSSDATVTVGTPVTIGYTALSNTTSNSKLDHVYISVTYSNNIVDSTTTTFTTSITSYTNSYTYSAPAAGAYRVSVTVRDKAGLTSNISLNVTAIAPLSQIGGGANFTLGGTHDSNGSYFDLEHGVVYTASTATANASNIELVYNQNKLYSPTNTTLETNTYINTHAKITHIDLYTGGKQYSAITASDVMAYNPSSSTSVNIPAAPNQVGSIFMFSTNNGKKGVLVITNYNGTTSTTASPDNISFTGQIQP